jgi:CDP-glycerol glycerophosphotransferase (TagB/SpsB family)
VDASGAKGAFAVIARRVFNGLYGLFRIGGRRSEVLFVSRKSDAPSYDYLECGAAFERRGLKPVYLSAHFKGSSKMSYFKLILRELYHLARCKVCVIDRYDPVVSMLDFECERELDSDAEHNELPVEPVVVQLWHAFGAFKKFGLQSLDVAEGHSSAEAEQFQIHRNNSWVVCSGEGARKAYAEAFGCPMQRVVTLSRPEYRKIIELRSSQGDKAQLAAMDKPIVLFAPTIRKYDRALNPFEDLERNGFEGHYAQSYRVQWSAHPLVAGGDAKGDVPEGLLQSSVVVTDYSSIAYEAFLLHKMLVFYVPDIAHYRISPGLNADPEALCPALVAKTEFELNEKISSWLNNPVTYPWHELENFVGDAFVGCGCDPATDLVHFIGEHHPGLFEG